MSVMKITPIMWMLAYSLGNLGRRSFAFLMLAVQNARSFVYTSSISISETNEAFIGLQALIEKLLVGL